MNLPLSEHHKNYRLMAQAIEFLSEHRQYQPQLKQLAEYLNLSEFYVQRLFSQWVGISPKQFVMVLTQQYAKQQLQKSSVLVSALNSGLSGPGRLHDLMVKCEAITPGEYKKQGLGLSIVYGIHESAYAYCLIATTPRGICKLAFFDSLDDSQQHIDELMAEWPHANIQQRPQHTEPLARQIFDKTFSAQQPLHLLLKGTDFQLKVWQALLNIPSGTLCSYQQVAQQMGEPAAVRAVASAIAKNKLALLIPCHRVIKSTGEFNQYRWGTIRKKIMITQEAGLNYNTLKP
jgi:AraC family transcriptional regulator of adaptative response/methylated-DNA-[protein]-cysteine methyltransferase